MKKDKNQKVDNNFSDFAQRPLSDSEIEMLNASKKGKIDRSTLPPLDNSDMAQAKRFVKKNKFSTIFVALTLCLLAALFAVLGFMLIRTIINAPSKDDYTVNMGDKKTVYAYKDYSRDGEFYFDMRIIASYADLVVSGGEDNIKIKCPDGTYVEFENGNDTAVVNGTRVHLGGTAEITKKTDKSEGKCLVPFSFIEDLFSYPAEENTPGMRVIFSTDDNTVIIKRVTYGEGGDPLKITFSADCFDLAEDIQMQKDRNQNPELAFACIKRTELVNKSNPLGADYVPKGLFSLSDLGCPVAEGRDFQLDKNAAQALCVMLEDMHTAISENEQIVVTSAYRSYAYQTELWKKYMQDLINKGYTSDAAEAELTRTSAYPGESEHQMGLCVDLIEKNKLNLDISFEETEAFKWLFENAHRYGFILRYPKGKESLTGYDYEPWHYRFVGIDAARSIHRGGICLEEYLGEIKNK